MAVQVRIAGREMQVFLEETGPTLTESDVTEFEQRLGYTLPDDYREFLLKYNGGDPVVGVVSGRDDDPDVPYEHGDSVRYFLKLSTAQVTVPSYERLLAPKELPWDLEDIEFPKNILPIAEDSGGNFFVLELGKKTTRIRFLNHEALDEPIEKHRMMADSFLGLLLRFRTIEEQEAIDAAEKDAERKAIRTGQFPKTLEAQCARVAREYPEVRNWVRMVSERIFNEKGYFAVHDDPASRTFLDLACWLYQSALPNERKVQQKNLETLILGWWREEEGRFGLTGHAPGFIVHWWNDRLATGALRGNADGARFTTEAWEEVMKRIETAQ